MGFSGFPGCDFTLSGFSLGGVETTVLVPEWRLALDVGRGRRDVVRCEHLALTHVHMDHAGGVPYVLALRRLFGLKPPTIYVPAQVAERFDDMLQAWDRVQRHQTDYTLVPVKPGESHPLKRDLSLVPFRTVHTIPSVGYTVVRRVEKLKPELQGVDGPELGRRRRAGEVITNSHDVPLLSFTGDTMAEVLDREPQILESRVLIMECTFLDESKSYEACRAGGHTHMDDLLERAEVLGCPNLVLSHFSQIHLWEDVPRLLAALAAKAEATVYGFPMAPDQEITGPIQGV